MKLSNGEIVETRNYHIYDGVMMLNPKKQLFSDTLIFDTEANINDYITDPKSVHHQSVHLKQNVSTRGLNFVGGKDASDDEVRTCDSDTSEEGVSYEYDGTEAKDEDARGLDSRADGEIHKDSCRDCQGEAREGDRPEPYA